ncbi:MAG: DUF3795 domain-containing protein [Bacteroidales bacterium]|nr:MAG: DUF3795 domain-containing protein [Bacteroidales bacterium]
MKEIVNDTKLIAYCGLYCGSCSKFLKESCPGCAGNEKATWCKVRSCNMEHGYVSCADCKEYSNAMDCKKFNNFMSKLFGFVFKSDRNACVNMIRSNGYENFASYMASNKLVTIKKQ